MTRSYSTFNEMDASLFRDVLTRQGTTEAPAAASSGIMAPTRSPVPTARPRAPQTPRDIDVSPALDMAFLDTVAQQFSRSTDDPLNLANTIAPLPRPAQEVDLSEWEDMPPPPPIRPERDQTREALGGFIPISLSEPLENQEQINEYFENLRRMRPTMNPRRSQEAGSFLNRFIGEMASLEGLSGDDILGEQVPTYSYGITRATANRLGVSPEDYPDMRSFAADFATRYMEEQEQENPSFFENAPDGVRMGLHTYLWNRGSFYPGQRRALERGDTRGFIHELRDVINLTDNGVRYSSTGLSKRRAAEANMIGSSIEGWVPITEVRTSGTMQRPTFEWVDANGDVVETYTSNTPVHSSNADSFRSGSISVPQYNEE